MDRLTDRLDMTIVVDYDIKQHSNKQTCNPPDFKFYPFKLTYKKFLHLV